MSAFSRLFALALFFVALILAENTVISRPLAGRLPRDNFSGASGPSRGGDAQTLSSSSSTNNCINGSCEGLVDIFSHNGGSGGLSKSGDATNSVSPSTRGKQCKRRRANDDTNAYSGAAGDSSGGTGSAGNSVINIFSGNGGNGGESVSGKSGDC
ncbi:hypothetical protein DFH05DRAFT_1465935 [Lentinula detonsa]|uniref:Uncharacterized protein n=1 Tax=Lentinula detonsa TaxID=2804962 RepID=A0A9W8PA20_9AGAR|nr:hypothetical protein DFH05DRAFT_1465935 [Lentinula detonsa]